MRPRGCPKDCPRRSATCHTGCEDYAELLIYNALVSAERIRECNANQLQFESGMRRTHRVKTKMRRKS